MPAALIAFPAFLETRRTAEKALAAVIVEARIHGTSTRSVDDPFRATRVAAFAAT